MLQGGKQSGPDFGRPTNRQRSDQVEQALVAEFLGGFIDRLGDAIRIYKDKVADAKARRGLPVVRPGDQS